MCTETATFFAVHNAFKNYKKIIYLALFNGSCVGYDKGAAYIEPFFIIIWHIQLIKEGVLTKNFENYLCRNSHVIYEIILVLTNILIIYINLQGYQLLGGCGNAPIYPLSPSPINLIHFCWCFRFTIHKIILKIKLLPEYVFIPGFYKCLVIESRIMERIVVQHWWFFNAVILCNHLFKCLYFMLKDI